MLHSRTGSDPPKQAMPPKAASMQLVAAGPPLEVAVADKGRTAPHLQRFLA